MRRVNDGAMEIDFDYCKGCGICEDVCPVRNAIDDGGGDAREPGAAARTDRADRQRGRGGRRRPRADRSRSRCYPITPQTLIVETARRARRRTRRHRVRESRERALDVRIRDRRRARRLADASRRRRRKGSSTPTSSSTAPRGSACRWSRSTSTGLDRRAVEPRARPRGQHEPSATPVGSSCTAPRRRSSWTASSAPTGSRKRRCCRCWSAPRGSCSPTRPRSSTCPTRKRWTRSSPVPPARRTGCSTRDSAARVLRRCPSRASTRRSSATSPTRMNDARHVVAAVASEFGSHFGRRRSASIEISRRTRGGHRDRRDRDDRRVRPASCSPTTSDLLVARVHAYRPFPAAELAAALARRLARLRHRPRAGLRLVRAAREGRGRSAYGMRGRHELRLRARRQRRHPRHTALGSRLTRSNSARAAGLAAV